MHQWDVDIVSMNDMHNVAVINTHVPIWCPAEIHKSICTSLLDMHLQQNFVCTCMYSMHSKWIVNIKHVFCNNILWGYMFDISMLVIFTFTCKHYYQIPFLGEGACDIPQEIGARWRFWGFWSAQQRAQGALQPSWQGYLELQVNLLQHHNSKPHSSR